MTWIFIKRPKNVEYIETAVYSGRQELINNGYSTICRLGSRQGRNKNVRGPYQWWLCIQIPDRDGAYMATSQELYVDDDLDTDFTHPKQFERAAALVAAGWLEMCARRRLLEEIWVDSYGRLT